MEKLREMVIKMAKKPLLPCQIALIEHQLHTSFPAGLHTPNHPPYAAMIYKAITELNEEGGSTEESISQYIKANYIDLPLAHNSFLSRHLRKLSNKGFVVFTAANCYMIDSFNAAPPDRKRRRSINRKRVTPHPKEYRVSVDNSLLESKGNNGRKWRKRQSDFDEEEQLRNAATMKLSLEREIRRLDNKGRKRSEPRRLPAETSKEKPILNESGDKTATNGLLLQHDTTLVQTKTGSSKGLVKRKKKDMIKWMVNALSDEDLPQHKSKSKLKHENRSTYYGNQMTDPTERRHPCFLQPLVETSFFDECKLHLEAANNKCHSYCLDCKNGALCTSCQAAHRHHNVIRICRTMWENTVSASKIQMYMDISGIQTHHMKPSRDLVSLKRTTQSRHFKQFNGACRICNRYLPESFHFCSLKCKIEHDLASSYISSASN